MLISTALVEASPKIAARLRLAHVPAPKDLPVVHFQLTLVRFETCAR